MRIFILIFIVTGCRHGLTPVTQRKLGFKQDGEMIVRSRPVAEPSKPPEIFIRQKRLIIEPRGQGPISGSLYAIEDPRNILLAEKPRGLIGTYLDINVDSNRLENAKKDGDQASPEAPVAGDKAKLEETLLKALPDLNAGKDNPVILKQVKVRVGSRLPNGDVMVVLARSSSNGTESNAVNIMARVPYEALKAERALSTKDLYDIEWSESLDGEYFERKSLGWEDEYTLRLSGFSEAKSKAALSLEEKKKQLKTVKTQMQTQLQNMTSQRVKIAQERDRLANIRAKHKEEKGQLAEAIETKQGQVDEQQEAMQTLEDEKLALKEDVKAAQQVAKEAQAAAEAAKLEAEAQIAAAEEAAAEDKDE